MERTIYKISVSCFIMYSNSFLAVATKISSRSTIIDSLLTTDSFC